MKTFLIFCAKCQVETDHNGAVDLNGELVFTCVTCGGFMKIPASMSVADIKTHFVEHQAANEGQVSIAESQTTLDDLFASETPVAPVVDQSQPVIPVDPIVAPVDTIQ